MTGPRRPRRPGIGKMKTMHDERSTALELPTGEEASGGFGRLRTEIRFLLWMTSASFVMMITIFIAVVWLER